MIWNYLRWCFRFKEILPLSVALVDDHDLSKEEYEFPEHIQIEEVILL